MPPILFYPILTPTVNFNVMWLIDFRITEKIRIKFQKTSSKVTGRGYTGPIPLSQVLGTQFTICETYLVQSLLKTTTTFNTAKT